MKHPGSLLRRLTLVQLSVFTAIWLAVVAYALHDIYTGSTVTMDGDLRLMADGFALVPETTAPDKAQVLARRISEITVASSNPTLAANSFAYQIWTADGILLARSDDRPALRELGPGTIPPDITRQEPGWVIVARWSADHRTFAVSGLSTQVYEDARRDLVTGLGLPWLMMVVLLGVVMPFAMRYALSPVRAIAEAVKTRATDDLSPVDPATVFTELRPVVEALNDKLARIDRLLVAERQFFADAAHELRTPLSAIGAQAHVLAHATDPTGRSQALADLEAGVDRAARVVSRLLTLGRLESASKPAALRLVDLAALAQGVVNEQRPRAAAAGQTLLVAGLPALEAHADPELVRVAIENLVDNALRHCPSGTTVVVDAHAIDHEAVIRVTDDGPGVARADRARVFERFQRAGAAAGDGMGGGLGLAIVARIAALHGGRVVITDPPEGPGASFELRLPVG